MPDQTGRVAIVTGGNSGIGFEIARWLLRKNAKVYIASRSEQRANVAIKKFKEEGLPGDAIYMTLDLGSLVSIKKFVISFLAREQRLDLLFNNGGITNLDLHATTVDGYETNMGINALGPHYLTQQLIPALVASYRTTPENPPRVCFTSSLLHRGASAKGFDPEDPSGLKAPRPFGLAPQMRAYGSSKFANILSVKKLDRQYGPDGIVFTAVHPGGLRTGILKDSPGLFGAALRLTSQLFFYPQEMGALTPLYAGTAPETAKKGGRYFASWAREVEPMTLTEHEGIQDAFDTWVSEQVSKHT